MGTIRHEFIPSNTLSHSIGKIIEVKWGNIVGDINKQKDLAEYIETILLNYPTIEEFTQDLEKKVDKIEGYGLSKNDFTDVLKALYDEAVTNTHTHENKAVLDTISGFKTINNESILGEGNIEIKGGGDKPVIKADVIKPYDEEASLITIDDDLVVNGYIKALDNSLEVKQIKVDSSAEFGSQIHAQGTIFAPHLEIDDKSVFNGDVYFTDAIRVNKFEQFNGDSPFRIAAKTYFSKNLLPASEFVSLGDGSSYFEKGFFRALNTDAIKYYSENEGVQKTAIKFEDEVVKVKKPLIVNSTFDLGFDAEGTNFDDYISGFNDKFEEIENNHYTKNEVDNLITPNTPNIIKFGDLQINDGKMSNFSATNYAQFPFLVDLTDKRFEIEMEVTFPMNNVLTQRNILDSNFGLAFAIRNDSLVLAVSHDGNSWAFEEVFYLGIGAFYNKTYRFKLGWTKSAYYVNFSTDGGETWRTSIYHESNLSPYPRTIIIGKDLTDRYILNGIINLNKCTLSINGQFVWDGMTDAGLLTRLDTSLSNIDANGIEYIKTLAPTPKEWYGTQAEFDALEEYEEDMKYYIYDDGTTPMLTNYLVDDMAIPTFDDNFENGITTEIETFDAPLDEDVITEEGNKDA